MTSRGAATIGELLDTAFTAYRKHAVTMVVTAAAVLLPTVLLTIRGGARPNPLNTLVVLLASVVATGQASEALLGRRPTLLGGLVVGLRRLVPALLSVVFFVVTAAAATVPFATLLWLANPRLSGFTPGGFVGALISLVLLWAVAMSWLLVRYFALVPVATLEPGASAPDRSAALARGAYGRITLVWLIGGLIYAMPMMLVGGAQGLVAAMQDRGNIPVSLVLLVAVLVWIANSIAGPFSTLLNTALYYDRRAALDDLVVHAEPAGTGIAQATVGSLATAPSR
jgi:hypothetical protein